MKGTKKRILPTTRTYSLSPPPSLFTFYLIPQSLRLEANKIDSLNALVLDLREGFPLLHRLDLRCLNDEDANPGM